MRDEVYERRDDVSKCWYRDSCNIYGTPDCYYTCKRFTQADYLFQLSNLPESCWRSFSLDTKELLPQVEDTLLKIYNDIEFFVKSGYDLYMYGESGCGKTSWAIKLLHAYFMEIAQKNDFTVRGIYINVSSFFIDAKLYMKYKSENYLELLRTLKKCDIVIWDDIGQTDPTTYESQLLYSFINERILAKKCNIFTSNLSPEQLEKVDKRLESRICKGATCLEITGTDKRKNNTYTHFLNGCE